MPVLAAVQSESFKLTVKKDDGISHNGSFQNKSAVLHTCRNSFAAFQILLQGTNRLSVNLTEDPWFSEYQDCEIISVRHCGSLAPGMKHIAIHEADDGAFYADRLMNEPVVTVPAGVPQSIYVSFEIPADATPGQYTGCFEIIAADRFEDERLLDTIHYTLDIDPYVIADHKDRSFELDLWQHNCNIARKAATPNWSEKHFALIGQYLETLAKIGQRTVTVIASEIPWAGQHCYTEAAKSNLFEYSMIRVQETRDGFTYDYSVMDRYIELCFQYGIDRDIEVFGLIGSWIKPEFGYANYTQMPEVIRIRYQGLDGRYRYMKKADHIRSYIRALHDHFAEKGWLDKVLIVADEPSDHEALRSTLSAMNSIAPGFRYKAAFIHKKFYDEFKDIISDFCIEIIGISWAFEDWKQILTEDRDHKFSYYVCCYPKHPNTLLSNDLLEARYIPALAHYYGLSGFLRWNYTVWPEDPRRDIRYPRWPAGDTNFVYPAADATPELSLRYMALRRGSEDFEILEQLRKKGREDLVQKFYDLVISDPVIPNFYDDDKSKVPFHAMSAARQEDYDSFRAEACRALIGKER